ncbi:MAG: ATP-binding protein, partial [Pseudomonadota bacterium]|nr:ATP-binding protein [Pseudomonadota bacterium]
ADPTRLRQVLINLLSNAIKYNHSGGSVVIQTRSEGDEVVVTVRDSGRGLRPDQIANLFEPFNRFGADLDGIQGTGIGLTIVKAIVDGMRGRIEVESQPGRGASFAVTLPRAQIGAGRAGVVPATSTTAVDAAAFDTAWVASLGSGLILYVEDNPVNVLLVDELLKAVGGVQLIAEGSGQGGVERARECRPDLILVDLQLPDFDGFEVLHRLRADAATASIPCIALSANAMPEDVERGLAAGFVDYWTKPIDFAAFIAAMHRRFPAAGAAAPLTRRPAPAGRAP